MYIVTGGYGFLGRYVVMEIMSNWKEKYVPIFIPVHKKYDLTKQSGIEKMFDYIFNNNTKPSDITIIHLAASVGGIQANQENPASFFYNNAIMGIQLLHTAYQYGIKKFVTVGTVCSYPKNPKHIPFVEEDLWNGYPEETNAPYGLAKRMLLVQSQAYRQQYGFNSIFLIPTNLYGPGDNFDPKTSHVIPALIKKFVDARNNNLNEVQIWGTGKPTREFLHVEDAAKGIIQATKLYNKPEPVNLGTGKEISIEYLAFKIADFVGYNGKTFFDYTKPDGQPRRCLDGSKAKIEFNWEATKDFDVGLWETINWDESNLK